MIAGTALHLTGLTEDSDLSEEEINPSDHDFQAFTEFTNSFESELGPEYVFDLETEELEYSHSQGDRTFYQASLSFELTDFGKAVLEAEDEEEVEALVVGSFESYPEGDYVSDLVADVELVENGRPEELDVEVLSGSLENVEISNRGLEVEVSFVEGEDMPELKFGSFSTVWSMEVSPQEVSEEGVIHVDEEGVIQTNSDGVVQAFPLEDGEQTQFYTDFSEYDDGPLEGSDDWFNLVDEGATFQVSDGVVEVNGEDGHIIAFDPAGQVSEAEIYAVLEIKESVRWETLALSAQDTGENYHIQTLTDGFGGDLNIRVVNSEGDKSTVSGTDGVGGSEFDIQKYRFRINGDELKASGWTDAESEPSNWQIESENTDIPATGHVGIFTSFRDFDLLEFGVGINGDSAPVE